MPFPSGLGQLFFEDKQTNPEIKTDTNDTNSDIVIFHESAQRQIQIGVVYFKIIPICVISCNSWRK